MLFACLAIPSEKRWSSALECGLPRGGLWKVTCATKGFCDVGWEPWGFLLVEVGFIKKEVLEDLAF